MSQMVNLPRANVLATLLVLSTIAAGIAGAQTAKVTAVKLGPPIEKGLNYLRRTQEPDGSWSHYPATTALAVAALCRNGANELTEPAVAKGVQFILRAVKPSGAIYASGNPATELPNYNTSLCMMALALTGNPNYKNAIAKGQIYLEKSQFDEGEHIARSNPIYGGIGYGADPDDHPDLGNLSTALQALSESGVPSSAPVFKKAIVFLQRVQNRTESNDQAWAKSGPNDGGFAYDSMGESKIPTQNGRAHSSMGAMTYAGLESYIYAGITRNDPRAVAAYNWIRSHYTVKEHPGMGDTSLYYYFHTMAKTLNVYGQRIIRDQSGNAHSWADELGAEIVSRQHPDGSWYSSNSRYWENQPALVTSYSLIALSFCKR